MNWRKKNNCSFEQPVSETPKERNLIFEFFLGVVIAVMAGLLLTIIPSFKNWAKNSPMLAGLLGLFVLLMSTLLVLRRQILEWWKRRCVQQEQAKFVQQWQAKFDELQLLEKLKKFENPREALSIIHIVESPSSYEGVTNLAFNPVYISKWLYCFERRPRIPTSDIRSFMAWCEEFTIIVDRFCQDYVLKGQERLESGPTLSKDGIDSFEQFRDEFNFYMQQAEKWKEGLEKTRCEVAAPDDQFPRTPLHSLYSLSYRVKSLSQNSVMQVPLSPQTRL
jgi:hypothetical protein